jgi:hypothetical protein
MKIALTEKAQADLRALEATQRASVLHALLALPTALGRRHLHSGLGIRKVHRSGVWQSRAGLGLRIVFLLAQDELILVTVGNHDAVRRFLRAL